MDLDEYLFYAKKKDKKFSEKAFAKEIGITHTHLINIIKGRVPPSGKTAYAIYRCCDKEVDVWQLIFKYYSTLDQKIEK